MQKSEFSIKINLSTATLIANHWCLWIETAPQLWMSSRFTYLYPFKHSPKVHTSRVASVTHFNLNNSNHYHCTCSAEFYHTAIVPWRGKRKNSIKWVPGLFRLLPWSPQAQQDFPSMDSHFCFLQQARQTHRSCWDWGLQSDAGQLFSLALQPLIS